MIISTIDPPQGINIIGPPQIIEERVCRSKIKSRGDNHRKHEKQAMNVSEQIFFLEYNLHSNLINQVKFLGKNSIFSLRIQIYLNESQIIGVASCTALTLKALPIPSPIKIQVDQYFKGLIGNKLGEDQVKQIEKKSMENVKLNFRLPIFKTTGVSMNKIKQVILNQQL